MSSKFDTDVNRDGTRPLIDGLAQPELTDCDQRTFDSSRPEPWSQDQAKIIRLEMNCGHRLPGLDPRQGGGERAAFLTLNLAALALVGLVLCDASRFALNREQISQSLSSEMTAKEARPATSPTNVTAGLQAPSTPQTAGAGRWNAPKS